MHAISAKVLDKPKARTPVRLHAPMATVDLLSGGLDMATYRIFLASAHFWFNLFAWV